MTQRIIRALLCLSVVLLTACGQRVVVNVDDHPQDVDGVTSASAAILSKVVDADGRVDFNALLRDEPALDRVVAAIGVVPIPAAGDARVAYLLNAYHLLAMKTVLVQGLPRDLEAYFARQAFYGRTTFTVAGKWLTLNQLLEREIAPSGEPRLFAALNGMAACFPRLRAEAYTGAGLQLQLEDAMREFANDPRQVRVESAGRRIVLSPLLGRYHRDLGLSDTAAILALIERYREHPLPGDYQVVYAPWDWTIIYQRGHGDVVTNWER